MSNPFTFTSSAGRVYSGRRNSVEPVAGGPLVIALHGGTYTSEYFDIPGYSLLERADDAGIPVIALDRPNYAGSASLESEDSILRANVDALNEAIGEIWEQEGGDAAGIVLVAHSIGGAIATEIAALQPSWPLLGLATSGCLVRVPAESAGAWAALPPIPMIDLPVPMKDQLMFGPPETINDDMPAASYPSNTLVPKAGTARDHRRLDRTSCGGVRQGHGSRLPPSGRVRSPVDHQPGRGRRVPSRFHLGCFARLRPRDRQWALHRLPQAERTLRRLRIGVREGERRGEGGLKHADAPPGRPCLRR